MDVAQGVPGSRRGEVSTVGEKLRLVGRRPKARAVEAAILAPNASARRQLAAALHRVAERFEVVAEVSALEELEAAGVDPGVAVFGARSDGCDRVRDVRRAFPDAILIAVEAGKNQQDFRGLLAEGADGIVLREKIEESLGPTIAAARAGQLVVPREFRGTIAKPSLSTREKQVLGMVVMGFSNGEIARKLVLAESTIKSHLSSAFSKLGVRSRAEAAALILDSSSGLGTGILTISGDEGSNGG